MFYLEMLIPDSSIKRARNSVSMNLFHEEDGLDLRPYVGAVSQKNYIKKFYKVVGS